MRTLDVLVNSKHRKTVNTLISVRCECDRVLYLDIDATEPDPCDACGPLFESREVEADRRPPE